MTINYTSLLALGQPVTGTEAGDWGNDVNNAITSYLDTAIAGTQSITSDANVTLSLTQGTSSATNIAQVGAGTTGSAQYAIILCSGARTAARNIVVPSSSREYIVINSTTGGFGVVVKGSATTGVTIAAGETALVVWNGSDFIKATSTTYTGSVTSVAQTFTGGLISVSGSPITGAGTLALTVAGTSGGVPYFSSGSTWASSAALASGALVTGGGAGAAPATITTGSGVTTALGVNTGTAGAFVVNGGALGTPSSGTLTNATGLPLSTGVTGTLPVANGGTGTATPSIVAGTNVTVSGTWPNQTIAAAGGVSLDGVTQSTTPFETALGYTAGNVNTGVNNTYVGYQAGLVNTTGTNNTFIGYNAAKANISASNNLVAGANAGNVMTGGDNTLLGYNAGLLNTSGNGNTFVGFGSGSAMVGGSTSTFVGRNSGQNVTGGSNTFIGANAGSEVTSGTFNTIVGMFNGNQNSIDARTVTKNVILSNGNSDVVMRWQAGLMGQLYASLGESLNVNTGAATGTINFDASSYSILYYTGNASANQTLNIRADGVVTLTSQQISSGATIKGSAVTVAYMVTNGSTAYRPTVFQIDGTGYTPKWQGGTAPTAGNANSVDVYILTCVYQSYLGWQIFASQTKFA